MPIQYNRAKPLTNTYEFTPFKPTNLGKLITHVKTWQQHNPNFQVRVDPNARVMKFFFSIFILASLCVCQQHKDLQEFLSTQGVSQWNSEIFSRVDLYNVGNKVYCKIDVELLEMMDHTDIPKLVRDLRDANEILDNLAIFSLEDLKLLHELQTQLLFEYYLMINELSRAVSSMRKELVFDMNALGSVESSMTFAEFQRIAVRVHNVKCRMDVAFEKLNSFVRRLKMGIDLETEFRRKTKSPVKFPLKVFYEFVTGQRNILELIITEAEWHTTHNTMYTLNGHVKSFAREIYWCVYLESSLEKARQEIYEESLKYK
ncbi:hypothetical protein ROZALSC1DRAFT_23862 [Rozella allomycis CSF55]|uniref:Uncharacterized protein n=1 Tax=Rozella allomycis (strain CSF55) TaxID=988480 RepID=A0A4P9YEY2_ROZAC|nr:hypothetical protein ROZALSC1DRAFT_23862 [Rozella allomycis CSF55]